MNFCPKCYGELTGNPGPRFQGHCPRCKQDVVMKADQGPLTVKINAFMGLNLSKEIQELRRTVDEMNGLLRQALGKDSK